MKIMKMNKVSLFLVMGFLAISVIGNSQGNKLNRQERKEAEKAQTVANFYALDTLLNLKTFVLEADFLQDKSGIMIPVSSNLNFIKIDKSDGILQTGTDTGIGYNGVGGVTAEGSIGSWDINKNIKKYYYMIHFNMLTNIGHYDILMTVNADGHARATITGLGPGRLTWDGHIEALYNSRVFKGTRTN
jgi:hypothetical protein